MRYLGTPRPEWSIEVRGAHDPALYPDEGVAFLDDRIVYNRGGDEVEFDHRDIRAMGPDYLQAMRRAWAALRS